MSSSRHVLAVNPWIFDFTAYDFWSKPLGLLSAASLARSAFGCRVSYIDCLDRSHPGLDRPPRTKDDGRGPFPKVPVEKPSILKEVPRRFSRYGIPVDLFDRELERVGRPDAVLMTCGMTYWYPGVQLAAERVRRRYGGVPIVLGGVYATLCPGHARDHSGADLVVRGPAEKGLGPALREVLGDGLPDGPDFPDFASLPPPALDLVRDKRWLPLLTSRGCPFRCTFCAGPLLYRGFEERTPESVAEEIAVLRARFGTRHFAFYDDALLVHKKRRLVPALESVVSRGLSVRFHAPNGLHIREIDRPLAGVFRASGFASLYLSLESSDDDLTRARTPKASAGDLGKALGALEEAGYPRQEIKVYLIMGLPGQSASSVVESVRFVRGLGAVPKLAFFSPIPGTAEWATLASSGIVEERTDPLLHNKLAFTYLKSGLTREEFEAARILAGTPGPAG